jgi:hypothetical protein
VEHGPLLVEVDVGPLQPEELAQAEAGEHGRLQDGRPVATGLGLAGPLLGRLEQRGDLLVAPLMGLLGRGLLRPVVTGEGEVRVACQDAVADGSASVPASGFR